MNTIFILGNIITIFLIVDLESTRLSSSERIYELETINTIKNKVIKEYLPNYDQQEAFKILSQYIMNEVEMYGFAEHLNRTGYPPEWSNARKLKNYKYYNFLRYDLSLEKLKIDTQQTKMRINYLNSMYFQNAPALNPQILTESYNERNLNELMLFKDYYASMIFLKNFSTLYVEDPASWRIRRALYSLAIRNYNPNSDLNYNLPCFFKQDVKTRTVVDYINSGDTFGTTNFIICSSKYEKQFSYDNENLNIKLNSYWINYNLLITDSILMVSLDDIAELDDEKIYVILTEVPLKVVSVKAFSVTNGKRNAYLNMKTSPIHERSNWLTSLANEIEKYKQMEKEFSEQSCLKKLLQNLL